MQNYCTICNSTLVKEAGYQKTFWAFLFLILYQIFSVDFPTTYSTAFFVKVGDNVKYIQYDWLFWVCHKKVVKISFVVAL